MKKALSLLLSFALLLGTANGVAAPAFAEGNAGTTAYCCNSGIYKDAGFTQGPVGDSSNEDLQFRGTITKIVFKDDTTAISNFAFADTWLQGITLPNGVKSIGEQAFARCSQLENVTIPASVTSIGSEAFHYCRQLKGMLFEGVTPPSFNSDLLDGCPSPTILVRNETAVAGYRSAFNAAGYNNVTIKALNTIDMDQQNGIHEVPDGLKGIVALNTVAKIEAKMKTSVKEAMSGVDEANIAVYDISLWLSCDNNQPSMLMTDEDIPSDGVSISLPYPPGTNKDNFDFVVTHMVTTGAKAGTTETIIPKKTETGLDFMLHSLSPVALGFKAASNSSTSSKPASIPSSVKANKNPPTGDANSAVLFIPLIAGAVLCGAVILLIRKKQHGA